MKKIIILSVLAFSLTGCAPTPRNEWSSSALCYNVYHDGYKDVLLSKSELKLRGIDADSQRCLLLSERRAQNKAIERAADTANSQTCTYNENLKTTYCY